MMQRSIFRIIFGACILGFAGISFMSGIFPMVVSWLFGANSFEVMLQVRGLIIPLGIMWVIGGVIIGWQGGASLGALSGGVCGLVSGLILSTVGLGGSLAVIVASVVSGLLYGAGGGFLIGNVFVSSGKAAAEGEAS